MAGCRIQFAQFGKFDSFDIVRSTVSLATTAYEDLPTPIVQNLKTMYFEDGGVEEGITYYYLIIARLGTSYAVSDEVMIIIPSSNPDADPYWLDVVLMVYADSFPIIDESNSEKVIDARNSPIYDGSELYTDLGSIYLDGLNGMSFGTPYPDIGVSDFTIECYIKIHPTRNDPFYARIIDLNSAILFAHGGNYDMSFGRSSDPPPFQSIGNLKDTWFHVCIMRSSGVAYFFANGNLFNTLTYPDHIYNVYFGGGGSASRSTKAYFNCCRITKVARYPIEGFTPPDTKFPDF